MHSSRCQIRLIVLLPLLVSLSMACLCRPPVNIPIVNTDEDSKKNNQEDNEPSTILQEVDSIFSNNNESTMKLDLPENVVPITIENYLELKPVHDFDYIEYPGQENMEGGI